MTLLSTSPQSPPHASAAPQILHRCRELVAPALTKAIGGLHPWVAEMAGYALGRCEVGGAPATYSQGKGVRQALAVIGAEAAGGSGDALRRGRPAVWKAYGTGPAVLAGDALFALAVETLTAVPATAHGATAVRQ